MCSSRCAFAVVILCSLTTVFAQAPTNTSLAITSAGAPAFTIQEGATVTLTATVSLTGGGAALPPGLVDFCDAAPPHCTDIHLLGTSQLSRTGTATMGFLPGPGSHTYQAYFVGTHLLAPSISADASFSVNPFSLTTTTISEVGSPGDYWLTAVVTNTLPTPPTGTVSFHDLGNFGYTLATAPLIPLPSQGLTFALGPQVVLSGTCTEALGVGDFNNDGKPDILSTSCLAPLNAVAYYPIAAVLGNGDATFRDPPSELGLVGSAQSLAVADFDGDGKQDVAAAMNINNTVQIVLGNGDGSFTSKQVISVPSPQAIVSADFNGDGVPDLAVTNVSVYLNTFSINTVTILLGNGDGTFTTGTTIPTGVNPTAIVAADFNGDGKLDLAIANESDNTLTILLGNGDGTFTAAPLVSTGAEPVALVAADLNGDGIPDLAVVNQNNLAFPPPAGFVTILLGVGNGTFSPLGAPLTVGQVPDAITAGDFNDDGKIDLVVANSYITSTAIGQASIFMGNGDGTFGPTITTPAAQQGATPRSLGVADFDAAGVSDIVVGVWDGFNSTILPQIGSQAYATVMQIDPVGSGPRAVDATYPGDQSDGPSTSTSVEISAQLAQPTVSVTVNPSNINYGQQSLLTITLTPDPDENIFATGSIDISYAGIGTVATLSKSGVVTLNIASPPVGTYSVIARYPGDFNFAPASGSATITVNALATSVGVTSSLNPAGFGQSVTFTATVTSPTGPPSGSILFTDGSVTLASVPLTAGAIGSTASFTTSTLAQGNHTITATYLPATGYEAGSATLTQVITPPIADFTISIANPAQTLQDGQRSSTTVTLTSTAGFADTLTLACSNLPIDLTCSLSPTSTKLAANGTATISLNLNTYILPSQAHNRAIPGPGSPHASPLSLAVLLPPICLFGLLGRCRLRVSILNLLLIAAFSIAALTLSGCGEIIYELPSVAPGTYTIPVTATGANTGLSHSAQVVVTITNP